MFGVLCFVFGLFLDMTLRGDAGGDGEVQQAEGTE